MIEDPVTQTLHACDRLRARALPITPSAIEKELEETNVTYAESLERTLRAADRLRACGRDITTESLAAELLIAPDPYQLGIEAMRAASVTDATRFEDEWKRKRQAEFDAEHARFAERNAEYQQPRLTAAELREFAPPDPYKAGLDRLRREGR